MTIRVRFRHEAEADVLEAFAWYRERGLELGEAFLRSLNACLATIQRLPESHPIVYRDIGGYS
jgi:plasmid stabilization system protein ParE